MAESELDALVLAGRGVLASYGFVVYVTGYTPMVRTSYALLGPEGEPTLWVPSAGDAEGAAVALEEIAPTFEELTGALGAAIAVELQEVSSLQSSADSADDIASWLRVAAIAIGVATGLVGTAFILRAVTKRRVSEPASPA